MRGGRTVRRVLLGAGAGVTWVGAGTLAGGLLLAACGDDATTGPREEEGPRDVAQQASRVYGEAVLFGGGVLRTWARMDGDAPVEIGVSFTEELLSDLPGAFTDVDVPFPVDATLFDHLGLDWNPAGHPPPGVYDVPHFDVHFYLMTEAERENVAGGPDPIEPEAAYRPAAYGSDGMSVPGMGVHWVDLGGPEFNGGTFTRTMVYGFTAGELGFLEPMITKAFLEVRPDASDAIAQPAAVQRSGHYPARYSVRYDAANRQYDVWLSEFGYREAG